VGRAGRQSPRRQCSALFYIIAELVAPAPPHIAPRPHRPGELFLSAC